MINLIMAFLSLGTGSWRNVLINFALVAISGGLFLYSYYSGKYQRCYLITIVVIFLIVFPVMFLPAAVIVAACRHSLCLLLFLPC